MNFINLTPHAIQIFSEAQFNNLEKTNPTTFIADGVLGDPILELQSQGCARISTKTDETELVSGMIIAQTAYGDATGIPDNLPDDALLVVSLPMQSMAKASNHPLADRMVAPYKVVRSRENGSIVLGAMGFTF